MKKLLKIIIFVIILLLTACFGSDKQVEIEQETVEVEVEPIEEEIGIEDQEVSIVEDQEEEKIVPSYRLHSDHTVKPIDDTGNERVVLLTIDDAPNRYSVEMAQMLNEKNINAIFFVNGHFISNEAGREKLKVIYELGFEIGNHTMNHPNLKSLSEEKQRQEIVELNDLIEEITGERPRFFRAPFGVNTEVSRQVVQEEGMQWMNWTYGYDFEKNYMEKQALAEIMVNTNLLRPGANLLMHDHPWTLEALPLIIEGLKDKGYEFVDPKAIE
jgi:peptidoglycan/xylan/chitin deacetylase (PgdA/CDA1 family)